MRPTPLLNAMTIDVEDYFHVSAFAPYIDPMCWGEFDCRAPDNTRRLLDILDERGVRATFFILGWVADRHPGLVQEIHARGHEVGSHSFSHQLVYQLTPQAFREDLRRANRTLEDIIQQPVVSYRAPSFSITQRSRWALEILVEEGIQFDSSVFPIVHDRYGIPGAPRDIHWITTPSGGLWEFPPSVARVTGWNLPVSGGGYFRLYPFAMTAKLLARINATENRPFMFYLHPWEIDPGQPRLAHGSRFSQWRHYVNLDRTEHKLQQLLRQFSFDAMRRIIESSPSFVATKDAAVVV